MRRKASPESEIHNAPLPPGQNLKNPSPLTKSEIPNPEDPGSIGTQSQIQNPKSEIPKPQPSLSLYGYATRKQLDLGFLRRLGIREITIDGQLALRIPYLDELGREVAVRYRMAWHDDSALGIRRFRWKGASKPTLYGLWKLDEAESQGYAWLVEAESDCHALWSAGIPAFAIPNKDSLPRHWPEKLAGVARLYVPAPQHADQTPPKELPLATGSIVNRKSSIVNPPDPEAVPSSPARNTSIPQHRNTVLAWLSQSSIVNSTNLVHLPSDPSALYAADRQAFPALIQAAMRQATNLTDVLQAHRTEQAEEAREACQGLASAPNILDLLVEDLHHRGVVGEERTLRLLYLGLTSRLTPQPVSVVLKGPSSSGKSFALDRVTEYFPKAAYYALSSMSAHAMVYDQEPLAHRMLILHEARGANGELTSYLLRSILSEGCVRYVTLERDRTGLRTRTVEREGPTGFITTTTAIDLHPEHETRMLSIPVADTCLQTAGILAAIAKGPTAEAVDPAWQNLQRWLQITQLSVNVPYAEQLMALVPPLAIRLRRDGKALMSLIQAHAILHQATRDREVDGRILATLEDYAAVRPLVLDLLSECADSAVPADVRKVVAAVQMMSFKSTKPATVQDVAQALAIDKSTASRRIKKAIALGYVRKVGNRSRVQGVTLGEKLPGEVVLLPEVADLQQLIPAEIRDPMPQWLADLANVARDQNNENSNPNP